MFNVSQCFAQNNYICIHQKSNDKNDSIIDKDHWNNAINVSINI